MPAAVCPASSTTAMASATAPRALGGRGARGGFERSAARAVTGAGAASGSRSGSGSCSARERDGLLDHARGARRRPAGWWWRAPCGRRCTDAHGDEVAALGHVLVDGVVGEARERAARRAPMMASTSVTPQRAGGVRHHAEDGFARGRGHQVAIRSRISPGIAPPDLHVAEARGAGAVAGAHHLLGLALAAVGHAPERPVLRARRWPRRNSRTPC